MAIARLSVKVGKAGKAAPHAEYIDRDEERNGNRNMQKPTLNIAIMETCLNGLNIIRLPFGKQPTFTSAKMAVPIENMKLPCLEMNAEQRLELVEDFIQSEIGSKYPYQFAIHNLKQWTATISPTSTSCLMNVCKMESNEIGAIFQTL